MKIATMLSAATLAVTLAGPFSGTARAATVEISGTTDTTPFPANGQFGDELQAAGMTRLFTSALLTLSGPARLTFTGVGAESAYDNRFAATGTAGAGLLGETADFGEGTDFLTALGIGSFTQTFAGGALSDLLFTGDEGTFGPGTAQFGVFTAADFTRASVFFLVFNDNPGLRPDGDHDDFVVRVQVAAVPLPAAGLLLLGGLAGLAALRRRRTVAGRAAHHLPANLPAVLL